LSAPAELRAELARAGKLALTVRVIPKSAKTEWAGSMADGTWKVRLRAVPEKGKANAELVRFLAAEFGLTRAAVEIIAGAASHHKQVRITAHL
jgi:uncharacterized protein (TIGR00251 family)